MAHSDLEPLRIAIIEDDPLMQLGLKHALDSRAEFKVVAIYLDEKVRHVVTQLKDPEATNEFTLSDREMEVLKLLVEGGSNGSIAEALFLSESTVKAHLRSIMSDAPTPTEAVWCRHLSPVKDIKIFLRGTPKVFPLRHFIVRNATRPTLALKKKSKYLRTSNILLAGGFSPKAKFPTKPHIFSCLGAKLDPDCYSLIYQYSIMKRQVCCSFSHALHCFWAQSLPVLQDRQSSTRLPFIPQHTVSVGVGIPVCLAKFEVNDRVQVAVVALRSGIVK